MSERQAPWYVETFLAIGGWIAGLLAAFAIFSMAAAIVAGLDETKDEAGAVIALIAGGAFIFLGLAIARSKGADFARHFSIASIAAGLTAATAGMWLLLFLLVDQKGAPESVEIGWTGLVTAALLALAGFAAATKARDGILTFLTALAVYGVATVALLFLSDDRAIGWRADHYLAAAAVAAGCGLFTASQPGPLRRPAGAALMIGPMLYYALMRDAGYLFGGGDPNPGWLIGEAVYALAALYCLWPLRGRYALAPLAAAAVLLLAAVSVLPGAGSVAIVILLAAVAANHRGLAVAGIIAAAWFIGRFYYDLSMTLLEKSAIMAGMGALMLAGAVFFRRLAARGAENRASVEAPARRGALAILGAGAVFALALGWVNAGVFRLETAFADAREIYLRLAPVDPRSLIQGDYMVLNYDNAIYPPSEDILGLPEEGEVFLKLDGDSVASFSRIADEGDVPGPDEIRIDYVKSPRIGMRYAPESFFFQEGEAEIFQPVRFAIVKVAPDGHARLIGLADENRERLGKR